MGNELNQDIAADSLPVPRPVNGTSGSPACQAWRELIRRPIKWAACWGSEGRTLAEKRIRDGGHWRRYRVLRERAQRANPGWTDSRVRKWVIEQHFGYTNIVNERSLYWQRRWEDGQYSEQLLLTPELEEQLVEEARVATTGRPTKAEMEERTTTASARVAFDKLPATASPENDLNWVSSHPKLFERGQHRMDEEFDSSITAEDIEGPSNGCAPSKRAVNILHGALSDPKEFRKQVMSEVKKSAAKPAGVEDQADDWGGDDELSEGDDDIFD